MTDTRAMTLSKHLGRALRLVVPLLVVTMVVASARAETDEPPVRPSTPEPAAATTASAAGTDDPEAGDETEGISYELNIDGIDDENIKDLMRESSQLISLRDRPPRTLSGLNQRAQRDVERFGQVLRSEGYYEGTITHRIDTNADPVLVTIDIKPGPPFLLSAFDIKYVGPFADDPSPPIPPLEELGLELDKRAEGAKVVAAGTKLLRILRNDARPLAKRTDRKAIADFKTHTLTVEESVDPGPRASYGAVTVTGLERTNESYVRQWIPWKEGEPYKQSQMNKLQSDLVGTGLFSSVIVTHAKTVDENGEIDITIDLEEDKPRTVGATIGYSTDRGPGGKAFWRHNNLFGNNEQLELSAQADFLEQRGAIQYVRPNFGRPGRAVYARAEAGNSDTDAYKGFDSQLSGGVRWPVSKRWKASVGGLVEYSDLKANDDDEFQQVLLWGVPGNLRFDGTDNELNPKIGVRLDLTLVPYVGTSDQLLTFNFSEVGVSGYYPLDEAKRYILAGRTRVASLVGEKRRDIPANKRIYAGGGDSIRGYGYQLVGPLNDDDDPIGGRSKIEFTGELRAQVYGDFGIVPFFAAGNAYDSVLPELSEEFQWAAGLGFRYYTSFGPIRLDVAFPLNRRRGVDDFFQLYFGIGQAF